MIFTLVYFVIRMAGQDGVAFGALMALGLDLMNLLWIAFLIHFRGQRDKVARR